MYAGADADAADLYQIAFLIWQKPFSQMFLLSVQLFQPEQTPENHLLECRPGIRSNNGKATVLI